jgi:hypothetical protein
MPSVTWAFGPPIQMELRPPVIPSAARNLLLSFLAHKSRFLVASLLGMTRLVDFQRSINKPYGTSLLFSFCLTCTVCHAQDLAPRAYLITPEHFNALNLTFSYFTGSILFNGATPITGASGNPHLEILSVYHAFSFFGRSANFTAFLPYGFGHFQGDVNE